MSRLARQFSLTGLYHIVFRGINKQNIFEETEDYQKMIKTLQVLKKELKFEIYTYCLMSNHVHLLLKEKNTGDISQIMKRLLTKYVMWYNKKYHRTGALIANRYKSQPIEVDEYFLSVVRYIHQNPLKAGITDSIEMYNWSSYNEYVTENQVIVDTSFVLNLLPLNKFKEFHKFEENEIFLVSDKLKITDDAIKRSITQKYKIAPLDISQLEKSHRNEILRELKNDYSIRQIERITGISRGIIAKS